MLEITNAVKVFAPSTPNEMKALNGLNLKLEDGEFAPMFESCEPNLTGKKIALFGSYGWGGGEWMEAWEDDCKAAGANLVCDSVICNEAPDGQALSDCEKLGASLA